MEFQYLGPRMRGAQTTFQQWAITPLSSNQYWAPNDVIKIMSNLNTPNGLVDFYRTHIQFEVQVTKQMMPVGGIQIDSSAYSIINQTVLLSDQTEIERIQEFDSLAAILVDLGFSEQVAQGRTGEGLGCTNIGTNLPTTLAQNKPSILTLDAPWLTSGSQTPAYSVQYANTGSFSPIMAQQMPASSYIGGVQWMSPGSDGVYGNSFAAGYAGGNYQSITNWLTMPFDQTWTSTYVQNSGRGMGVRSQYNMLPQQNGYLDAPYSIPLTAPFVKNQKWTYPTMNQQGYNPTCPYETYYSLTPPATNSPFFSTVKSSPCGVTGYTRPMSPQFARGTGQPVISPTIPQVQMINGQILPQPVPLFKKTFRMPLLSAIVGILIPPDQYQLIPVGSLINLILQITLNPYAFFTTGYSDVHQFDTVGMQAVNMQKRNWRINSFQWVWHLYTFSNSDLVASIQQKLIQGINISSNYWQLQAQQQLPNGSYVKQSFQIPANVQSLAQVLIIFLSNQYMTKTFCRKQFRLSNNITSMQFKANGTFFPLQPIQGNAGNPQSSDVSGDNWNFYEPLLLSNNFLFNTNVPLPRINVKNFAINGRIYDTTASGPYLASSLYNTTPTTLTAALTTLGNINYQNVNCHTAMGLPWFHENRYVGKAVFCYSFQPYGHSKGMIGGLDTRPYRQFEVTFGCSPYGVFPHDQTMLIFSRSNIVVKYTNRGISILGA